MGFAFAHHFASYDAVAAMTNYRSHFKPSGWGEGRTHPRRRSGRRRNRCRGRKARFPMDLNRLRRDRGQYLAAERRGKRWPIINRTPRCLVMRNRSRLFVGSPATIMAKLQPRSRQATR